MAAIAVDLDNTLTDRPPVFDAWLSDFLHEHAIEDLDAPAEIRRLDADGFGDKQHMFEIIRSRWQLAPPVGELIESFYGNMVERTELPDGARQGLSRLVHAGYDVLVVTNGSPRQQDKIDRLALRDLVHGVAVSSIVGVRKPQPGIFEAAARDAGLTASDIGWMIGDSAEADIRGAAAIGARSVWLSRGRDWPLDDLRPFAIATTFSNAVDLVVSTG